MDIRQNSGTEQPGVGEFHAGQLVKSVSIENMVNQRAAVLERVRNAIGVLREARDIARQANIGFPRFKLEERRYMGCAVLDTDRAADTEDAIVREVDAFAWQYLMTESGLRTFMDAEARRKWDEGIAKGDFPPFTLESVEATFRNLYWARGEMFERGVLEVFKHLSWDYKTNRPFAFGKRIILRYVRGSITAARGGGTSLGYVNHDKANQLDDLTRVFHVLDGKPEPDHRAGWYSLLGRADKTTDPDAENDYMRVACFRNGNGHATFKRMDLVDKMNQILAKHYPDALPHDKRKE